MIIMTKEDVKAWIEEKKIKKKCPGGYDNFKEIIKKEIPIDSGQKNYFAKNISTLSFGNRYLLFIDEYGIWPSSENMELFNAYRKSLGILVPLAESPGHLFSAKNNIELYCLLDLILINIWGCLIISEDGNEILQISHDEYFVAYVRENLENSSFLDFFTSF